MDLFIDIYVFIFTAFGFYMYAFIWNSIEEDMDL